MSPIRAADPNDMTAAAIPPVNKLKLPRPIASAAGSSMPLVTIARRLPDGLCLGAGNLHTADSMRAEPRRLAAARPWPAAGARPDRELGGGGLSSTEEQLGYLHGAVLGPAQHATVEQPVVQRAPGESVVDGVRGPPPIIPQRGCAASSPTTAPSSEPSNPDGAHRNSSAMSARLRNAWSRCGAGPRSRCTTGIPVSSSSS